MTLMIEFVFTYHIIGLKVTGCLSSNCCSDLPVQPSRGALELGRYAKSGKICGLCLWFIFAFRCCGDYGRRGRWHVDDDCRHHDPGSFRRVP